MTIALPPLIGLVIIRKWNYSIRCEI